MKKQLSGGPQPDKQAVQKPKQTEEQGPPDQIQTDDFNLLSYLNTQDSVNAALVRVTQRYSEILKQRYYRDPVTVLQYAAVELAAREAVLRKLNPPGAADLLDDYSRKVSELLSRYRNMQRDPRFDCEPSVQAFRRQVRLEGGMARLVTAYQSDIKAAYMSQRQTVFVALPFEGSMIPFIRPSVDRENMYRSNLIEGQFAVSGRGLCDYIMRAACGQEMYTNGNMSFFPASPISEFRANKTAVLLRPVSISEVSAMEMDPEVTVDFDWPASGFAGLTFRYFEGEWTRKTRGLPDRMKQLPVLVSHVATFMPAEYFYMKAVKCKGPDGAIDLSGMCRQYMDPAWRMAQGKNMK